MEAIEASRTTIRLTVEILPPADANAHGSYQDEAIVALQGRKFALPAQCEDTFGQLWSQIELRCKTNYLSAQQAATFTIHKLQDAYDCDLDLRDTVGSIFESELDTSKRFIRVVPATSNLRPSHAQKRTSEDSRASLSKRRRTAPLRNNEDIDSARGQIIASMEPEYIQGRARGQTNASIEPEYIQARISRKNSPKVIIRRSSAQSDTAGERPRSSQSRRRGRPPKNAKGAGRPRQNTVKSTTLRSHESEDFHDAPEEWTHTESEAAGGKHANKSKSASPVTSIRSSPAVPRRPAVYLSRSRSPEAPPSDAESEEPPASPTKATASQANDDKEEGDSDSTLSSDSESSTSEEDVDVPDTTANVSTGSKPADVPSSPPHASPTATMQANDNKKGSHSDCSSSHNSDVSASEDDVGMADASVDSSPAEIPSSPPYLANAPASTPSAPESSQLTLSQPVHKALVPVPSYVTSSQSVSTQAAARRRLVRSSGFPTLREQLAATKKAPSASQNQSHDVKMLDSTKTAAKGKIKSIRLLGIGLDDEDSGDESSSSSSSSD